MLQFLFFGTRICLLNFHTMWVLPVLALAALLVFRLLSDQLVIVNVNK